LRPHPTNPIADKFFLKEEVSKSESNIASTEGYIIEFFISHSQKGILEIKLELKPEGR